MQTWAQISAKIDFFKKRSNNPWSDLLSFSFLEPTEGFVFVWWPHWEELISDLFAEFCQKASLPCIYHISEKLWVPRWLINLTVLGLLTAPAKLWFLNQVCVSKSFTQFSQPRTVCPRPEELTIVPKYSWSSQEAEYSKFTRSCVSFMFLQGRAHLIWKMGWEKWINPLTWQTQSILSLLFVEGKGKLVYS